MKHLLCSVNRTHRGVGDLWAARLVCEQQTTFSLCENVESLDSSKKEKTFCTNWMYFSSSGGEDVEGCPHSCNEQSGEILSRCLPYATWNERALTDLEKKKKESTLAFCLSAASSCVVRKHSTCCLWVDVEDDGHTHMDTHTFLNTLPGVGCGCWKRAARAMLVPAAPGKFW